MNRQCPGCRKNGRPIIKYGHYYRRSDARLIQRFLCTHCGKHFSQATFSPCYRQKKRRLNARIRVLLSSAVSLRRIALILGISRTTVDRKFVFLADQARKRHHQCLETTVDDEGPWQHIQFDDLVTFEHTKCKPVTVTLVVDARQRTILDFALAPIPAGGPLAEIARKKYGKRRDLSRIARRSLFQRLICRVSPRAEFTSDEHQHYPVLVRTFFPQASHTRHKSIRGCVTGQGELKKTRYDPLFSVNHTLAMLRANINRLVRRTWCTTKKIERLADHVAIYLEYHNRVLLAKSAR